MNKQEDIILSQIKILKKKFKIFKNSKKNFNVINKLGFNDLLLIVKIKLVLNKLENRKIIKWSLYKILFIKNIFIKKNLIYVLKFFLNFSKRNSILSDELSEIFYDYSVSKNKYLKNEIWNLF